MSHEWLAIVPAYEAEGSTAQDAAERVAAVCPEPMHADRIIVVAKAAVNVYEVGVYQVPK